MMGDSNEKEKMKRPGCVVVKIKDALRTAKESVGGPHVTDAHTPSERTSQEKNKTSWSVTKTQKSKAHTADKTRSYE